MSPDSLQENIRRYWEAQDATLGRGLELSDRRTTDFREHPVWFGVVAGLLNGSVAGRPIRRVADFGSGLGNVSELLARLGYDVIAVDFSESRSAQARERLQRYPNAEVRVGDVTAPPIEPGEVDAIVSRNLIWLLTDPVAAVSTWAGLVAPGGRVAAIESTHRVDRHRGERAQRALGLLPPTGNASGPTPVTRASATPLSAIADLSTPAQVWSDAGLGDVTTSDLGWVTSARTHDWPIWKRMLRRDSYFAVSGNALSV